MFIFIYSIYVVVSIIFLALQELSSSSVMITDFGLIILQIMFYGILAKMWWNREDRKKIKEDVTASFELPITKRPTHMKIQYWIVIVLMFELSFTSFINYEILFYISTIMNYALMIMFAYPIFIESNLSVKRLGIFKIIAFGVVGFIATFGMDFITGMLKSLVVSAPDEAINQILVTEMILANPIKMFVDVTFTAAITEEIVFRGLGFRTLLHRNKYAAYIITFLIFGFVHLIPGFEQNGWLEFAFLPIYGGMALIAGYVYHKSESIYPPMIIHFLNNLLGFIAIMTL